MHASFREEKKFQRMGYKAIAGLDEVGRGPLAGPVVACALIVKQFNPRVLNVKDSKKLSQSKREEIYKTLLYMPHIEWGIGRVSEKVIDRINIAKATKLAMERAVKNLQHKQPLDFVIIDGILGLDISISQKTLIKADESVFSCAAASIIAKVTRDRIMERYHTMYPHYGFNRHKRYVTRYHVEMLLKYGPCKIHRFSFRPILNEDFKTHNH